jgi:hypothetical protein
MKTSIRNTWLALPVAAAVLVGFSTSSFAAAQADASGIRRGGLHGVTQTGAHKFVNTTIDWDNSGVSAAAGFTTIDTNKVTCANNAGCTIDFGIMMQVGNNSVATNRYAICALVDGNYINPGCPFQGEVPTDGTYLVGNYRGNYKVAKGSHTVSFQAYIDDAAFVEEWQANYTVLKP